jgi:hypothetical protein
MSWEISDGAADGTEKLMELSTEQVLELWMD